MTAERDPDLRVAHLHLRTGLLALARAELETAAGNATLDGPAMLDLAEIRWRTGDLAGGGVAAEAFLSTGGDAVLGRVIAAEAAALDGRQTDARLHAEATGAVSPVTLDAIFAGMPRVYGGWPGPDLAGAAPAGRVPEPVDAWVPAASTWPDVEAGPDVETGAEIGPGPEGSPAPETAQAIAEAASPPEPTVEWGVGPSQSEIARLAVALRLDPERAAEIVEAVADEPGIDAAILRGDGLRALGREDEARQAYEVAASLLGLEREGGGSNEGTVKLDERDPASDAGSEEDT